MLIIEDDGAIRSALLRALADAGHAVTAAAAGMDGLQRAVAEHPDVVVLDLGLPDIDGAALLTMLRSVSDVAVIVATARDDEAEIVRTLDVGADDYITKPFSAAQLEARIRAVLRRRAPLEEPAAEIVVGGLRIEAAAREASLHGRRLDLSRLEFDLLHHLAGNLGKVVTKRELMAEVWRQPYGGADKTVEVHLSWLRRKLGETAAEPRYLHTVRGVGVKLVDPQSGEAAP